MGRAPCCDKTKVKRGPWSPQEDATLKTYLQIHGTGGNWITLPQKAGLKRCGKSCRLRWLNYLRPDIKHGGFTEEEDNTIIALYSQMGSRWSLIASHLPGRTDNDVKNYWNTKLKKKLLLGGNTSLEIKHNTNIISPVNYTNNPTVSCSPPLLPFVPKSEPNSSSLFTFKDSITQNSDNLPLLSDIIGTSPTMNLDPIHQFSYPSVIIDHVADWGSNLISSHIISSSQEGSSISNSSSIAIDNKQLSLPSNDDIINLEEEEGILMDYGFIFPNYDTNLNGVCFQDKSSEIASTCYPNLDGNFGYTDINQQGQKKNVINH